LTGFPAPTFTSPDTSSVKVTADGLVTARKIVTGLRIVADLAIPGNARHLDTLLVDVTNLASPPFVGNISIDPIPPDSAKLGIKTIAGNVMASVFGVGANAILEPAVAFEVPLIPRITDTAGTPITGLRVESWSLDSTVAVIDRRAGVVIRIRPGQVRLVAQAKAYGVGKVDTALYTVTGNAGVDVTIQRTPVGAVTLSSREVRIIPYGHVFWDNALNTSVEVTFDDPTNVLEPISSICSYLDGRSFVYGPAPHCDGGGNMVIPPVAAGLLGAIVGVRGRRFPVPGTYSYHVQGLTGQVIVTDFPIP
jgi:hypothetical protein